MKRELTKERKMVEQENRSKGEVQDGVEKERSIEHVCQMEKRVFTGMEEKNGKDRKQNGMRGRNINKSVIRGGGRGEKEGM